MPVYLENHLYENLNIGDSAYITKTLTKEDIKLFAIVSGDMNPAHLDEDFAKDEFFQKIIAHGMWGGSLISSVIGSKLPGPGTIYLHQSFDFTAPVVLGDTVTITVEVKEKLPKRRILLDCHCENQDGKTVIKGEALVIAPMNPVKRPLIKLPRVEFRESESPLYNEFLALSQGMEPLRTAVIHPGDNNSLGGAIAAAKDNLVIPILIGPKRKIEALAADMGLDLSVAEIIDVPHSHAAADLGVQLVREGKAEALMKGKLHTQEFLKPIVGALRTERRTSHVFAVDVPAYPKPLFLTDAAINIAPNLIQKKDITQNAIDLFRALYKRKPKVAVVSAVETVDEKIPSTLDATALCKMSDRGQITGGIIDGPLALDNAISKEAAQAKGINSPVAGEADIIICPDIEAGNMLYKQMRFLSGAEGAGLVLGAKVPVILTSRAGSEMTRKASCAMALVYARKGMKL